MFRERGNQPVRLYPKSEPMNLTVPKLTFNEVIIGGSFLFGLAFAIVGVATAHYGVFL